MRQHTRPAYKLSCRALTSNDTAYDSDNLIHSHSATHVLEPACPPHVILAGTPCALPYNNNVHLLQGCTQQPQSCHDAQPSSGIPAYSWHADLVIEYPHVVHSLIGYYADLQM